MKTLVLVDEDDREVGVSEVINAHRGEGKLHRAVSVLVYRLRTVPELLIQKRSREKLLWGGFWSNTVCTHPAPEEAPLAAALRRLSEELGITVGREDPVYVAPFTYHAAFSDEYSEFEYDHVFVLSWDGVPRPDPLEVSEFAWMSWSGLINDLTVRPALYTPWFSRIVNLPQLTEYFRSLPQKV